MISVSASQDAIFEGGAVSFAIYTDQYPAGTQVKYRLQGVSANDIAGGQLSGVVTLDGYGKATVSVRVLTDEQVSPALQMSLELTGVVTPAATQLESALQTFMAQYGIPGLSVAVAYNDRLVYADGFGNTDLETREVVSPETLFRLASVSKPITSAIVMDLVEQGKLSLDQQAFPLLGASYTPLDSRVSTITINDLLHMAGGWDRTISPELVNAYGDIRSTLGMSATEIITGEDILEYGLGHTMLDFAPGTQSAYSNFSYVFLGEIIEQVTGLSYEEAAQNVLALAGISDMQIGEWSESGLLPNEAHYYQLRASSLYSPQSPYDSVGVDFLSAIEAAGGWIGSAIDLIRFTTSIDGNPIRQDFLTASSVSDLVVRPNFVSQTASYWYGNGWVANLYNNAWHTGALPGTSTAIVRYSDGLQAVVLANTNADGFYNDQVFQVVSASIGALRDSPTDLFSFYGIPLLERSADVLLVDLMSIGGVIDGSSAADRIMGTPSADRLFGYQGNDVVLGTGGNDSIDGGAGIDVAELQGARSAFVINRNTDDPLVWQTVGPDGTDLLLNIERLSFQDRTVALDIEGNAGQAYRIYQAAFDRQPDETGLGFWIDALDRGLGDLDWVARNFIQSNEFRQMYGDPATVTNETFLDLLYANVLNRDPDQGGLTFWLGRMNGGMTRDRVLVEFSESAENKANVIGAIDNGIEYTLWAG